MNTKFDKALVSIERALKLVVIVLDAVIINKLVKLLKKTKKAEEEIDVIDINDVMDYEVITEEDK